MYTDQKATKSEKTCAAVSIIVLFVFFLGVIYSVVTNQIRKSSERVEVSVDWSKQYPFQEDSAESTAINEAAKTENLLVSKLRAWDVYFGFKKSHFEKYHSSLLPGYQTLAEYAQLYNATMQWNYVAFDEYNGVIRLDGDYFVKTIFQVDVTESTQSVIDLDAYCKKAGIGFLYVSEPTKICQFSDTDLGDFCNQDLNKMLSILRTEGVQDLDLRENLHQQNLDHHSLFYRTDHHWKTTVGVWAAHEILAYCNKHFSFNADLSLVSLNSFREELYENWFLGSLGKKVTLMRADPEDFVLLYPKYETNLRFVVPTRSVDLTGSYEIMYDMSEISKCDYYMKNPYAGCAYGEAPMVLISNYNMPEGKRVLLLRDSMSDCVIPCLSMGVSELHCLDLRTFNGSVRSYIDSYQPDLVIVMYVTGSIEEHINWNAHSDKFNFL